MNERLVNDPRVTEPLRYRDGREGVVDPVLIERRADGSVRIVVNYPPAARRQARNRFLIGSSAAIALTLTAVSPIGSANHVVTIVGSLWLVGVVAAVATGLLWLQSSWTYVFETSAKELCFERRAPFFSRRSCFPRQVVRDIHVATNLRGRAAALVIRATHKNLGGRYFEYLDERCIHQIATALREGLALNQPAEAK